MTSIDTSYQTHCHVCRPSTTEARLRAVRRVIAAMRERYAEALSLEEFSDIAISSPFHLNRIFHAATGLPPFRFLAAIRLQAAKQLLLTTCRSVTDICFGVGYSSLGTFTAQFSQYVGASPSQFRRLSRTLRARDLVSIASPPSGSVSYALGGVHGYIYGSPSEADGELAIIGLYRTSVPRGHPCACAVTTIGSRFALGPVPPGSYHLFAAGIHGELDDLSFYLGESLRRGYSGPVIVRPGAEAGAVGMKLRLPRDTDPPLLIALPVLMAERAGLAARV